ncbi:MAG: phosphatase PAP2 family protein [Gammaproteobacteria bacterium]|nr:phosphatase PAP2 family protein [Gammaproteobacteria bacterium]
MADGRETESRGAFLGWPGWPVFRHFVFIALALTVWFAIVFVGADAFTAMHSARIAVHTRVELGVPFVPWMIAAYMSIYLLFVMVPFVLRTRREVSEFGRTLAILIFVSGISFLLLPAQLAFDPPSVLGIWGNVFQFADRLNLDYNLVPSLHVGLSAACVSVFTRYAAEMARIVLWLWLLAICMSTVLTHQHHIIDVVTGLVLGLMSQQLIYARRVSLDSSHH